MRLALLCVLSLAGAFGQTTTVTQNVLDATGNPANGTVLIRLSAACESGATYVSVRTIRASFTGGNFSIALVPNDTCVPAGTQLPGGTFYTATWQVTGGRTWTETWVLPTSSNPVSVSSVIQTVQPLRFGDEQIDISWLTSTQCLTMLNGQLVLVPCGGSGGKTWAQDSATWAGTSGTWASQ